MPFSTPGDDQKRLLCFREFGATVSSSITKLALANRLSRSPVNSAAKKTLLAVSLPAASHTSRRGKLLAIDEMLGREQNLYD
jgi:hypothetical protein